ncbi:sensor histidine kinase [Actinoplanes sp. GCM10030250]|uniref:sensor histidine kinase n=1 Tax=Actinoplanes sp. GCM10030250 TaxID=3273376 RepID=UPI00360874CA
MRVQWRDAALAAAAGLAAVAGAVIAPPGRSALDAGGLALLLASAAALVVRRLAPVPVLVVTAAALVAYMVAGYPGFGPAVPVMVAAHTVVSEGHRRAAGAAVVALLAIGPAAEFLLAGGGREATQRWLLLLGWIVASAVMAEVLVQHRAYLAQAEQRAAEAERTREEAARRRAGEERLRIARELHDSLTHCISIIKVQAGVAVHLARKSGDPVPPALLAIQDAGAEAMRELRATLDVLHGDEPEHGLHQLKELVDRAGLAGVPVTVTVRGHERELPGPVSATGYRIVQESLTNVGRHAGQAPATVLLDYGDNDLTVEITDEGTGPPGRPVAPGRGLSGMAERVAGLGGSLDAGWGPAGGFLVRAKLPLIVPEQQ